MNVRYAMFFALLFTVISLICDWFYPMDDRDVYARQVPQLFALAGCICLLGVQILVFSHRGFTIQLFPLVLAAWVFLIAGYAVFYSHSTMFATATHLFKFTVWAFFGITFFYTAYYNYVTMATLRKWLFIVSIMIMVRTVYMLVKNEFVFAPETLETFEVANLNSYLLLWFVPFFLPMHFRPLLKPRDEVATKMMFLLIVITMVLTQKRGPLLALLFGLVIIVVYNKRTFAERASHLGSLACVILVGYVLITYFYPAFLERFDDFQNPRIGIGHGRVEYWHLLVQKWASSDLPRMITGFGFFSVPAYMERVWRAGVFAHNDWVEVLFDLGLIGAVSLLCIHISILNVIYGDSKLRCSAASRYLVFGWALLACSHLYTMSTVNKNTAWIFIYLGFWAGYAQREIDCWRLTEMAVKASLGHCRVQR